jgi:hypothetical protein
VTEADIGVLYRNVMKILILMIAYTSVLACARAPSGTVLDAMPSPSAVIPQYNLDSVTRDSTSNRLYALVGTVVDSASGQPIPGASITLGQPGRPLRGAYSDDRGGFVLGRVVPGRYQLLVRRIGYMANSQVRDARAGVVDTVRAKLSVSNMVLQ